MRGSVKAFGATRPPRIIGEIMSSSNTRPKWWQVYLSLPLLVVLLTVDSRLKISNRGHQAVQIGIILFVYGLMYLWVKANAQALREMDQPPHGQGVRTVHIGPYPLPDSGKESTEHLVLLLPDLEIKGVLNDTFEMDTIDAEFLPVDEVPQELDKE
jgi:hypothetical protein